MKTKFLPMIVGTILLVANSSYAQSIFSSKEEVADYLEGEWNLDVVQGGLAGITYYLPSPHYYDSSYHKIVFEKTPIDSTPLLCTAYINDTLFRQTYVRIQQNPSQVILPRWFLFNVPENLEINVSMMESWGFYGFSQDTMVLSGNIAADGFEFGLTRLMTSTKEAYYPHNIKIYPNPTAGILYFEGLNQNIPYEVYTISGKLVKYGRVQSQTITIEHQGIYILRLRVNEKWISKKVVVNR